MISRNAVRSRSPSLASSSASIGVSKPAMPRSSVRVGGAAGIAIGDEGTGRRASKSPSGSCSAVASRLGRMVLTFLPRLRKLSAMLERRPSGTGPYRFESLEKCPCGVGLPRSSGGNGTTISRLLRLCFLVDEGRCIRSDAIAVLGL